MEYEEISLEQYITLNEKQEGICEICKNHFGPKLVTNYNLKTGKVRGLLCQKCDEILEAFNDDPVLIEKTIKYVEDFKQRSIH